MPDNLRKVKKTHNKKLIYFVLAMVVVNIVFSIQTVAYGSQLSSLEKEKENIEKDNKNISLDVVNNSSLTNLRQKSEDLGFVNPNKTLYLGKDEEVAVLR